MSMDDILSASILSTGSLDHDIHRSSGAPDALDRPPMRIRVARTQAHFRRVLRVRREAYALELPELADHVVDQEELDFKYDPIVLLAEDPITGEPFGTLRLNSGRQMLHLLSDLDLPDSLTREDFVYISRLGTIGPRDKRRYARHLLEKSIYQLSVAKQYLRGLILAVVPRERLFMHLGFRDVFSDRQPRFPEILNKIPSRALFMEARTLESSWRAQQHPLYASWFETVHPEIEVFSSIGSANKRSRSNHRQ